jgi:1-acyl-sn-glycerol-3-phosphate acyltransferase
MQFAVESLRGGAAIGIFPEGRLSRGEVLRARSGVTRLHEACPEAKLVLAAISGTTDYVRFPKRPRVTVELFAPSPELGDAQVLLDAVRERVSPALAGRHPRRKS